MDEPVATDDAEAVVGTLRSAFADDPFMAWIFSDRRTRRRGVQAFYDFVVRHRGDDDELWAVRGHGGAALWMAPRPESSPAEGDASEATQQARAAFGELVIELVGDRAPGCFDMFGRIADAHPSEPHWYLAAVGTRPELQGQGLGAAVLAPVLARCDAEGLPVYLESSNPRNIPFYYRLGFVETGRIDTPDGAAHLTPMWRDPRPS